jgi:hypothetical protein
MKPRMPHGDILRVKWQVRVGIRTRHHTTPDRNLPTTTVIPRFSGAPNRQQEDSPYSVS